ncbi:hypothetical protein CCYA_CCYA08G2305 [Cyanidiococcus yangmingshanensis]|nr:hypothetical protein CCYA_CCYA08G2305 [Cyanidiococcus yangmingshanensis]
MRHGVCSYCESPLVAANDVDERVLVHPVLGRRWPQVWLCAPCRQVLHDLQQVRQSAGPEKACLSDQTIEDADSSCAVCADVSTRLVRCQRCSQAFCGRCFGNTLGERRAPPGVLGQAGRQVLKRLNEILLARMKDVSLDERVWALPSRVWLCPLCRREHRLRKAFEHWLEEHLRSSDTDRLSLWIAFRERYSATEWDAWWRWCRSYLVPQEARPCLGSCVRQILETASVSGWPSIQSEHEHYASVLAFMEKIRGQAVALLMQQPHRARYGDGWAIEPLRLNERAEEILKRCPNGPEQRATTTTTRMTGVVASESAEDVDWHRLYGMLCVALRESLVALAWSSLTQVDAPGSVRLPIRSDVLDAISFNWDDLWNPYGTICFRCGRAGNPDERLQICDVHGCGKVYHATCVSCLSREPLLEEGALPTKRRIWYCPRHFDRVTGRYLPSEPSPVCLASWLQAHSFRLPDPIADSIPWLGAMPCEIHPNPFLDENEELERQQTEQNNVSQEREASPLQSFVPLRAVQCRTCPFSCAVSKTADYSEVHSDWYRWSERLISCASCSKWLSPPMHPWTESQTTRIEETLPRNTTRGCRPPSSRTERKAQQPRPNVLALPKAHGLEAGSADFEKALRQAIREGAARISEAKARGDIPLIQGRSGEYIDSLAQVREEYEKYERGNAGAVVAIMAALKRASGRPMTIAELTLEVLRQGWYVTRGKTPHMTFAAFFSTKRQRLQEQGQTSTWFEWLDHGCVRWSPH